jgi:hypothetical protein
MEFKKILIKRIKKDQEIHQAVKEYYEQGDNYQLK